MGETLAVSGGTAKKKKQQQPSVFYNGITQISKLLNSIIFFPSDFFSDVFVGKFQSLT